MKNRPIAKSLHTVSVLADVARALADYAPAPAGATHAHWVNMAAAVLGYDESPDPYALKAAAVRKLEKET